MYKKSERGYVLWKIQDLIGVYTIVNTINGYMRTPKIEALNRTINWYNDYININNNSKIRKSVFVYDMSKNFVAKYDGVVEAQRALGISHSTIKNYAKVNGIYKGYMFSYERLNDQ